jgi:hypothetical protein
MGDTGHHEQFHEHGAAEIGSDRSFCFVFAGVFTLIGLWPLLRLGQVRVWALVLAGLFLLIGLTVPKTVHGLNVLWMKLAVLISKITNPIVTGLLFFFVFTPFALFFRIIGRDPLRLRKDPAAGSYWILRQPPGPDPSTMPNQY